MREYDDPATEVTSLKQGSKMRIEDLSNTYNWVPMYLSPESDFLGYDGERMIGRVSRDRRSLFTGTWCWSNAIGSNTSQYEICQGYAATKELAVLATENHDRDVIKSRDLEE